MKEYDKNIDFYKKLESPFGQSEDELWAKIESRTTQRQQPKFSIKAWYKYAVAASVILLVSITLFAKFYTQNIATANGERLAYLLPDGSEIQMNSASAVSYHPYWWTFSREIEFSGEAFFNIEKGSKFRIISENGVTEILGTSFNIYARNNEYEVFCKTGKVKVSSTKADIDFVLIPGELAVINSENKKGSKTEARELDVVSWQQNKFNFAKAPFVKVIESFERQYNVTIKLDIENAAELTYTGYFDKAEDVSQSLDLVCKTFNLNFKKNNNGTYTITEK